jgi:type IV secretion system protein VirB4
LHRRAWGRLLDAEAEHLGTATVQAFETEGLIGTEAAPAVLAYLFHRIEDRLDGSPTLIIVDEGWLALDDEGFAGQLREWLKTLRKKNASVIFATQSLSDIDGSAIAPAIIESCQTGFCSRTSARSSRRSPPSIAASASTTGRSRSSRGPCPSATITASRGAATGCSSWA